MRVAVYFSQNTMRSVLLGRAMLAGIRRAEGAAFEVDHISSMRYRGGPRHDVALFYGLADNLDKVFSDFKATGRQAIYIDLGYWCRKRVQRFDGYHKLVLNDRHPTAYFQREPHDSGRFETFGIPIKPWQPPGKHVVVVGMSGKGAMAEGFRPHQWESETIAKLRTLTDRPIVYRPKPTWLAARPIAGSTWMQAEPLAEVLDGAHCVVTHHSNVAIDAILAGVPAICPIGVASVMSARSIDEIERLPRPDGRAQWAADIAWTQWSVGEITSGAAWRYLRREVLA